MHHQFWKFKSQWATCLRGLGSFNAFYSGLNGTKRAFAKDYMLKEGESFGDFPQMETSWSDLQLPVTIQKALEAQLYFQPTKTQKKVPISFHDNK
jgi:hypothetical protein